MTAPLLDTRRQVPAAHILRLVPPSRPSRAGTADVRAHHGEVLQGMFYSADGRLEHALVTMPCDHYYARARFRPVRSGPLVVEPGDRSRARLAARLTLDALGRTGWGGALRVESNIPLAWGCGSSTADVLSAIMAVADAFDTTLEPEWMARLSVAAETASDSLMYPPDRCLLFAQRVGTRLVDLGGPLPPVQVLGFNTDVNAGGLETLRLAPIRYDWWEMEAFQPLLGLLRRAVEQGDPELLGRVTTASAAINQRHRPKPHMAELLRMMREVGALGIQVAHSGTVAGFLFEGGEHAAGRIDDARAGLRRLGLPGSCLFATPLSPQ